MQHKIFFNDSNRQHVKNVALYLNGSIRPKIIGSLDILTKTFSTKRSRAKHVHRNTNSLAFNYQLLNLPEVQFIEVNLDGEKLFISKAEALKVGKNYRFGKAGYELQLFVPLDKFSKSMNSAKLKVAEPLTLFGAVS